MSGISPAERLLRTLGKQSVDRSPVICPGGMMNAAIVDIMEKTGHLLPEAHEDHWLMARLSHDVQEYTGFENFGIPFCMTIEAELLGSEIHLGSLTCEPKVAREAFPSVSKVEYKPIASLLKQGRMETIIQAVYQLSRQHPDIPAIGSLTGPVSTAASIVDPMTFLKELRKDPVHAHQLLDYVTRFLTEYARLLIDNGARVISIADPTATGEILGPRMFEAYAVRYLNLLIEALHDTGTPVIVHICGDVGSVREHIARINADAISVDANVNLRRLKEDYPHITAMGNISTYAIEFGTAQQVTAQTERLLSQRIDIIAPACGLSTSSPLRNITAMTGAVKEH